MKLELPVDKDGPVDDDIAKLVDAATEDDRAADDMSAALLNAVVGNIEDVLLEVTAYNERAADEIAGLLLEVATEGDITADDTGTGLLESLTDDDRAARGNKKNSTIYFKGNRRYLRKNTAIYP